MDISSPIELNGTGERWSGGGVAVLDERLLDALRAHAEVTTDRVATAEASRDWWPLALHWALAGAVPRRAAAVVRPTSTAAVSEILTACASAGVPITPAGGRSGVVGGSVPVAGGVLLDLTGLAGVRSVDPVSGVVEVRPGTFGPDLERELRELHGLSVGHFPQSFDLATVGGWVAARGAGQYSTRYGKIEDLVVGLEVVLADGRIVRTGGAPAAATGPDLTALFVGSEGTLGVITDVWLRTHPVAPDERRAAWSFPSFGAGAEACRRILQRGATPAVLRLYDAEESARGHDGDGSECILLVLDEADGRLLEATMAIVAEVCAERGASERPVDLVDHWVEHRNDTSALQELTRRGFVVDTMEIAVPWSALDAVFERARAALMAVDHARAATCHLSHSYPDGACLYFTFAATPPPEEIESTYVELWDAGQRAILAAGGNLAHHHGVGINRGRFVGEALGAGLEVVQSIKDTLDPTGMLNPGTLGLRSAYGEVGWPDPGRG